MPNDRFGNAQCVDIPEVKIALEQLAVVLLELDSKSKTTSFAEKPAKPAERPTAMLAGHEVYTELENKSGLSS